MLRINNHVAYLIGWRIIGTTTKTTYETPLTEPSGLNFFCIKAQKGELESEGSNVAVL